MAIKQSKRLISLAMASSLVLGACASSPDKMTAVEVSPLQYKDYNCKMLRQEMSRVSKRVNQLHQSLESEASGDAVAMGVGLLLFWPALFMLEGGDGPEAVEYRQLKGEYEAIEKAAIQKKCDLGG